MVRGDHVDAKPHHVASTERVARAREGLADAAPGPSKAERARGEARLILALFSVVLLWCSSLSASEALVDLVLPPTGRPTETATVADAASLLVEHARRAERDNAVCAARQTNACIANVRLDSNSESRRATDIADRNDRVALLATAVAEACTVLDTNVENALRVVANAHAPEDLRWMNTLENCETCTLRDRAAIRARAAVSSAENADDTSTLGTRFSEAFATYRLAAESYHLEADAALTDATSLVKSRAAYDEAYAANKTVSLRVARVELTANVTVELEALARVLSESLSVIDTSAGQNLRDIGREAAEAFAETRDEVEETLRTYVRVVRSYAIEVSGKLAEAKQWFDAFSDIGSFIKDMLGDLATSLPTVDAPTPPALTLLEISPQVVPNVSGAIEKVTSAATAGAEAVAAAADDARLQFANAAARVSNVVNVPEIAVFEDYRPPPRTDSDDHVDNVAAADAYALEARAEADNRWSVFSEAADTAAGAVDAERAALNATRANATGELEQDFVDFEQDAAEQLDDADPAGTVATFAAESTARLDEAAGNASVPEWLGVASPDFGAWRAAKVAASAASDGVAGADLAYRFARSFQHIARHFKGSKAGRLPPVDLTVAAASQQKSSKLPFMLAASAIGHPACLAALRVAAAVLVITLITQAYVPFYDAYRHGCVVGCDGTFVTQNIHSFSHNFAAAAATRAAEAGKAQVERERRDACAREAPASASRLANSRADIAQATASMWRAGVEVQRARRCVDFEASRLFFARNATANVNASIAVEFLEDIQDTEVARCLGGLGDSFLNEFTLDASALFDCSVLRACASANCHGPRVETLAPLSRAAGCLGEGTMHASLLRFLLVAVVFVAANAMRETAVKGVAALIWRTLTGDDGVSFRGTLSLDGAVEVDPSCRGEKVSAHRDPKSVARSKIQQAARAHEARGLGKLVLAVAAQVPGFVALWYARKASLQPVFTCEE